MHRWNGPVPFVFLPAPLTDRAPGGTPTATPPGLPATPSSMATTSGGGFNVDGAARGGIAARSVAVSRRLDYGTGIPFGTPGTVSDTPGYKKIYHTRRHLVRNDVGNGFRCIRMVNNIYLNFDAFHGDKSHDRRALGVGDNQSWKILPWGPDAFISPAPPSADYGHGNRLPVS
uniref:Uncharacterized protein n=1 Tax=Leersia perrieri TaxID=77586 RepID=A0A0D9X309_9ORYZ